MIHLDTNYILAALAPDSIAEQRVSSWLRRGETVAASAAAWGEFLCGPVPHRDIAAATILVGAPMAFDSRHAEEAARLFNLGGRRRNSFPDCMIAATAMNAGARLATRNVADFERFTAHGLRLEA